MSSYMFPAMRQKEGDKDKEMGGRATPEQPLTASRHLGGVCVLRVKGNLLPFPLWRVSWLRGGYKYTFMYLTLHLEFTFLLLDDASITWPYFPSDAIKQRILVEHFLFAVQIWLAPCVFYQSLKVHHRWCCFSDKINQSTKCVAK